MNPTRFSRLAGTAALLTALLLSAAPLLAEGFAGSGPWMVRAWFGDDTMIREVASWGDHLQVDRDKGFLRVMVDAGQLARLERLGFYVEVDEEATALVRLAESAQADWDRPDTIPAFPCYRTVEETYASAQALGPRTPRWPRSPTSATPGTRSPPAGPPAMTCSCSSSPTRPSPAPSRCSWSARRSMPASTRPPRRRCASPSGSWAPMAPTPTPPGCSTSTKSTSCCTPIRTAASRPRPAARGGRIATTPTAAPAPSASTSTATSASTGAPGGDRAASPATKPIVAPRPPRSPRRRRWPPTWRRSSRTAARTT